MAKALLDLALALGIGVFLAFAFSTVWGWHVVRLGAPPIGMATAFGIVCLAKLVTGGYGDKESRSPAMKVAFAYGSMATFLGLAWLMYIVRGS